MEAIHPAVMLLVLLLLLGPVGSSTQALMQQKQLTILPCSLHGHCNVKTDR